MAQGVENHLRDTLQKTETIKSTIEYIRRENIDKRSPMMMCLALERFMIDYNMNLQPCYERNISMVTRNIEKGIWPEMTYDETMETLRRKENTQKKTEGQKNAHRKTAITTLQKRKSI